MPSPADSKHPQGTRAGVPALGAGRSLSALVRDKLTGDPAWATFTRDQRRWVCPWCLAAIARRQQRSWEDSIGAHLEGCKHYSGGRFQPQPPASVQAQLSYENMICTAETDPAWGVFDSQGQWICPACIERVADARLVANQRTQLTYRAMALHLQRCAAYGRGQINAAPVVRAARDRVALTRATPQLGQPVRTPTTGAPQVRRTPSSAGIALPVRPPSAAVPAASGIPVATPVANPLQRNTPPRSPTVTTQMAQPPPLATPLPPAAPPGQLPPAAAAVTGTTLRPRRFLTPSPDAQAPVAPAVGPAAPAAAVPPLLDRLADDRIEPPAAVPSFGWMDDANEAAGKVVQDSGSDHVERSDLMRARDLQQRMLAVAPEIPGYRFATRYEPCDHVSGDFFSFVNLLDGRVAFAIGDVSGHGMQAGLVMSMAKKTLEIYGELVGDPAEVLSRVNDALVTDLGGKMFVSMTYAILAPSDRVIKWARAGHNPTMLVNIHNGEHSEIRPPGMVVGMKGGQTFRDSLQVETTQLRTGDLFLLYTDGVTEAANAQGEEFQTDRLRDIVVKCAPEGPEPLLTHILDRVRHFRGSQPVADDVTLLALAVE